MRSHRGWQASILRRGGWVAFTTAVGFAVSAAVAAEPAAQDCALAGTETRTVIAVPDGETLQIDGGGEARLIGALAPRAFDAGAVGAEWPLAEAARSALQAEVQGRSVKLAFAGRRTDRYGRLLAHVFIDTPTGEVWLQGSMLKRGLARAYAIDGSDQCLAALIAHERVARDAALGLWAEPAYSVHEADNIAPLLRMVGTFQLVEGTVSATSQVRGATYINFGEDWRQDFTVIARLRRPGVPRAGAEPSTAEGHGVDAAVGQRVRVRGWLQRRGGPLIEIHNPLEIEIVQAGAAAAATSTGRRSRSRSATRAP